MCVYSLLKGLSKWKEVYAPTACLSRFTLTVSDVYARQRKVFTLIPFFHQATTFDEGSQSVYTLSAVGDLYGSRPGQNQFICRDSGTFPTRRRGITLARCRSS
jgi:hypothetical protein